MLKIRKRGAGFTLIELLVVMGLIAVVAAGIVSVIGRGPGQSARDAHRKADLEKISSAMELYRNDNGRYPGAGTWRTDLTGGGYLQSGVPTDPVTGADYTYTPSPAGCTTTGTRCTSFTVCADLEKVAGICDYTVRYP